MHDERSDRQRPWSGRAAVIVALATALLAVGCGSDEPTLEQIKVAQNRGAAAQTVAPLRKRIDAGERSSEILYLYGVALSAAGERDAAMWPLRKAMEDPEWIVRAGMQMSLDAHAAGNNELAIKTASRVIDADPEHAMAYVMRARAQTDTRRNMELAVADTEKALEIDPDLHAARVARTVALLALERVEEAAEALEEMETLAYEEDPDQPASARYCGARASFAKEKGDRALADERYSGCLEKYPGAQILVGDAIKFYESLGQTERVREILTAAVEAAPDVRDFRVGLAMRQAAAGLEDEAEATLRAATESDSPTQAANAWLDLSGWYLDRDRIDDGVEAIANALQLLPNPAPEMRFRYADALIAAERYDEALAETENMRIEAHRNMVRGRVHVARGEWEEGLAAFEAGLADWPENAVARYYSAIAAEGLGNFDRAVEEYRYSIRAATAQTDARLRLAKLHDAEGLFEDAIAILRHDLSSHPSTPEMAELELEIITKVAGQRTVPPHLNAVVNRPGLMQRALSVMTEGLRLRNGPQVALDFLLSTQADVLQPANGRLLRDQVALLVELERSEEAEALARRAIEAHPQSAAAHAAHGLSLLLTERKDAARAAFEKAVERDARNADALMGLGRIADLEGDLGKAAEFYLEADAAEPRDVVAIEAAIDALTRAERLEEAERHLEALLEREPFLGRAALRLVELRVARDAEDAQRTRVLAKHAMRFGGAGPAAEKVLAAN